MFDFPGKMCDLQVGVFDMVESIAAFFKKHVFGLLDTTFDPQAEVFDMAWPRDALRENQFFHMRDKTPDRHAEVYDAADWKQACIGNQVFDFEANLAAQDHLRAAQDAARLLKTVEDASQCLQD